MPMYSFKCNDCGHEFDRVLPYKDRDNLFCPACDGVVKRLLSCGSFVIDGVMASKHSNSPEGQACASELRKKNIKRHTHREFKKENQERAKKDGKFTYR